jgi:hypothetical protein
MPTTLLIKTECCCTKLSANFGVPGPDRAVVDAVVALRGLRRQQ